MHEQSCTLVGNEMWQECTVTTLESGAKSYSNRFTDVAMPDPVATLEIVEIQPNLREMILSYQVTDPNNPNEMLIDSQWTSFRHAFSNYEEECQFLNKSCAIN